MQKYDVLVYGATGFTGRQAAAYLARHPDTEHLRVAIAGRSAARLADVRARIGREVGVVVADSTRPETVDAMVATTRVVASTAGPFSRYGDPVVDACVRHGADYVDITGETPWIRRVIDRLHDEAAAKGVRLVPCCGFDSIPSDLGAWLIVEHLRERGKETREVKGFFQARAGKPNGGTVASGLAMAESGDDRALEDPLLLNPAAQRTPAERRENPDQRGPQYDDDLQRWTAPFIMAPINTRVVRRSAGLALQWGEPYGQPFRYREALLMGATGGRLQATLISGAMAALERAGRWAPVRRLIRRFTPDPGEGPSEAEMNAGFFRTQLVGRAPDGTRARAVISGQGDPANRATVKMLCEAALCLAVSPRDALPGGSERGGVLTPATALGPILVDRLRAAGIRVEITG